MPQSTLVTASSLSLRLFDCWPTLRAITDDVPILIPKAMLVSTMVDELERRDLKRAMLSLCVGGGMGISTIIERV